jgi:hypothetical protein
MKYFQCYVVMTHVNNWLVFFPPQCMYTLHTNLTISIEYFPKQN